MKTFTFEVVEKHRTIYPVFMAGFHNSPIPSGEVFLSEKQAQEYCKDKVIYVKSEQFYSEQAAVKFVAQQAHCWINHIKSFGNNPADFIHQIECIQFRSIVSELLEK